MKHYCKYCGEKLAEDEKKTDGCCDRCNYNFATLEDECDEYEYDDFPWDEEAWVVCPFCCCGYNILDPDSECCCGEPSYYDD